MKKILLTIITIFAINAVASAQMRFGIKGGLNLANESISSSALGGLSLSPSMRIGFHAGLVMDSPITESISIQPNLLFSQKGFKLSANGNDISTTFNYIELPINFLYHASESFSVGAGPYLGYALSGTVSSGSQNTNVTFGSGEARRLDYGLNLTAGYEVSPGLVISANYSLGLANISDDSSETIKNNVIGFSLTKFFGEK